MTVVHTPDTNWHLAQSGDGSPEELIFSSLLFPLLFVTKHQALDRARERGWMPIMTHCWTCHNPLRSGHACGCCNPCLFTLAEGFGDRIGWRGRLRTLLIPHRWAMFKLALNAPLYRKVRAWKRRLMPWAVPASERRGAAGAGTGASVADRE